MGGKTDMDEELHVYSGQLEGGPVIRVVGEA
jgi:hypothetical protein